MKLVSYLAGAYRHYAKFGLPGVALYRKKQSAESRVIQVRVPSIARPVHLRTNSSDIGVFDQIFLLDYYKFAYDGTPKTIVDCGANIGLSTVYFKNTFPDARVIAIEPDPANFGMLQRNTAHYDDVTCLNMGVWQNTAFLQINNREFNNNSGFMVEEVPERSSNTIDAISIEEITDRFALDSIDILKVDIEGSEKEVFEKNFERWLPKVKLLIIETHDFMKPGCAKSLFTALNNYDYHLSFSGESFFIRLGKS